MIDCLVDEENPEETAGSPLDSLKILQQSASNMFSYPE